jgi:hypothetical protein
MPVYSWEGRSAKGAVVRGELEAPTRDHALARLKTTGVTVIRVDEGRGEGALIDASSAPPLEPARKGQGHDLFTYGALAFFTAIGIGVGYVSPVLDYDCTRDAGGSVDCAIHRRVFGLVPRSTLHFRGIRTVQLVIGGYSQSMAEQMRQVSNSTRSQSWDALAIVTADGSSWQSHQSSSPMGQTNADLVNGIDGLLKADAPAAYQGWTIDKTPIIVAAAFFIPVGFVLLGLVLRLVIPKAAAEKMKTSLHAYAVDLRRRRGR